ncbi:metallophosphoesterase [Lysinibacillus yapensis]|uniref:Metallophosphoesterase n=1 Tax=Ureibacillus yapensis TaxID=2304605 RepID=A0A396S8N2_9BACL|nr:metallophosphoesterase family protein [Lysinibacillus yapensis]RHW34718.1 metallophosphoesterase [Lysinibacillus yapensis]
MKYALLGDLHSHIKDTKAVLHHIRTIAPDAQLLCLGDLYECKIGKKKARTLSNAPLSDAAIISDEFEDLLSFPSIKGNQEERITKVTGIERFAALPERIQIEEATLIHGHQIQWDDHWEPVDTPSLGIETPLLFFGHSHRSGLYVNSKKVNITIQFGKEIPLFKKKYWINVGSVVVHGEWCLYDSENFSITFMKASKQP